MKKRVLWLCNHCTLVKTEPQIMENCGLEVFIPKTSKNPYFYTTFEKEQKKKLLNNFRTEFVINTWKKKFPSSF